MRRILKIVTAVVLLFTMLLSISLGSYAQAPDVKGHWAEVQINDWMEKGFVKGYSDGSFRPENAITRAEYFALVNRSLGFFKKSTITFKDVSKKDWFEDDVSKAKAQGYLAGYQDNTAAPNKPISRQEMITILARILKLKPDESAVSKFSDTKAIASWAKGSVGAVNKLRYINEYSDKSFKPDRNATRAEVVAILSKAIGTLYNSTGAFGPATETKEIPGNVTISKANVVLKNTVINGNLYLTEGIGDGAVTLENVTVLGTTTVSGGGERSIVIINSSLGKVVVNVPDNAKVRLIAKGTTKIEYVEACSSAKFEEDSLTGTGFNEVLVEIPEGASVELAGNFDRVDLKLPKTKISILSGTINVLTDNAKDALITVGSSVTINTLTVNQPLKLTGNCIIGIANINSSNVTVEPKPKTVNIAPNLTGVNITGVLPAVVTAALPATGTPSGGGDPGGGDPGGGTPTVTGVDLIVDINVAYGTTIGAITLPAAVTLRLSNSTTAPANVVWDTSTYRGNTAGIYTFSGTFTLPTGVTNPDSIRASVRVSVGQQIITLTTASAIADIQVAFGTMIEAITLLAQKTLEVYNT